MHEIQASGRFPEPLDSYTLQLSAFVINPADNLSVDITQFSVPGSHNGFSISSSCRDADITSQFRYSTDNGSDMMQVTSRALAIAIQHSAFTLALTACMFVANWVLTLASLYIAFSAMKKGRVTWSAFILHSTMALVIPSIRKLYLCPPPFGVFLGAV